MIEVDNKALLKSLQEYKASLKNQLENLVRTFALEITEEAIQKTPLGNSEVYAKWYAQRNESTGLLPIEGYARGSWQATSTGDFRVNSFYGENSSDQALALAKANLASFTLGQTVNIGNTAYYFSALENNYSGQTGGAGIIKPTTEQIQRIYSFSISSSMNKPTQ